MKLTYCHFRLPARVWIYLFIYFFFQVDSAWSAGNYESARSSANTAKILNIVGFVIGGIIWVVTGIIVIASAAVSASAASAVANAGRVSG